MTEKNRWRRVLRWVVVVAVAILALMASKTIAWAQDADLVVAPPGSTHLTVRNWIDDTLEIRLISDGGVQTEMLPKLRKMDAYIDTGATLRRIELRHAGASLGTWSITDPAIRVTSEADRLFFFVSPDGVLVGDAAAGASPFRERIIQWQAVAWYLASVALFAVYVARARAKAYRAAARLETDTVSPQVGVLTLISAALAAGYMAAYPLLASDDIGRPVRITYALAMLALAAIVHSRWNHLVAARFEADGIAVSAAYPIARDADHAAVVMPTDRDR